MKLEQMMDDYEIGGIGDIKKHTLRFHSYSIGKEDGKLTIYAKYDPGKPPKVFKSYPSGQELLIDLCNLNLELRDKLEEQCAEILIRWSLENLHPCYYFGDDVVYAENDKKSPSDHWDFMVNVLGTYYVHVKEFTEELERLYTSTMTVFAIRKLLDGELAEAQRIYDSVKTSKDNNLIRAWLYREGRYREMAIEEHLDKIPWLAMKLDYNYETAQVELRPAINSVIDAAYFALARFIAVNANALDDYSGKTSIAFCEACGKAFIKRGNRQKYCGTIACQSVRNKNKSRDYYYRHK